MARRDDIHVIITIDDHYKPEAVAEKLSGAGLRVEHVMGALGVVSGAVTSPGTVQKLRAVGGVESVEIDRTYERATGQPV